MHSLHSFLPIYIYIYITAALFFYQPPQQDFDFPVWLGCTSALSSSLVFPDITALSTVHWCSQWEFLVNSKGAINPPSLYTHIPVPGGVWQAPALCRKAAEEQQDAGQQLGDTPLKQGRNLLMGLAHRWEKRQESTRFTEKSLYQEKHSVLFVWMLLRVTKKSTREQCFAGEQARFRPAQSTINQFLC